jgi:hypothetical protein
VSRDQRWTGGIANREWQRGTRAEPPPVDTQGVLARVRRYIADCERWQHLLRAKDHPTEDGAVKLILCPDKRHEDMVRRAFRYATARGGQ